MTRGHTPWGHRLNWKPSLPDYRDLKYEARDLQVPAFMDLRGKAPPVVDQGNTGSCTGNAIAYAMGYLALLKGTFAPYARMFIYWNERALEGDTSQDAGAFIRDGISSVHQKGACPESAWPYSMADLFKCPPSTCYGLAWHHRISSYASLDNTNLSQLKACLASGFPFVFGISVYENFFATGSSGRVPMPWGNLSGGHALCCFGYDDAIQCFIVRNSWGSGWGNNGDCYIPYAYLTNPNLGSDFWTLEG